MNDVLPGGPNSYLLDIPDVPHPTALAGRVAAMLTPWCAKTRTSPSEGLKTASMMPARATGLPDSWLLIDAKAARRASRK